MFCFFVTSFIITLNLLPYVDQDKLNDNHKYLNILIWAMIKISHQMKEDIGLILFNTINYYLNKVIAKTLINPLSANFTKWSKTLKQVVFGHFVG